MKTKTLIIILMINILYIVYRFVSKRIYINKLQNLKDELFLRTLASGIDVSGQDYLRSEFKLDILIKSANQNVMLDFLFFKFFLMSKKYEKRAKKYMHMFEIKNPEMKKLDDIFFEKAVILSKENLYFGTVTGWVYAIFIFLKILSKIPEIKIKIKTTNIKILLKKIFEKLIDLIKNEMFLESKIDYHSSLKRI